MTFHFAYGSNMNREVMRRHAPQARPVGPAWLDHHRFLITRDGYASVMPTRGAMVRGILWRLTPRDLAGLRAYEALDSGLYRPRVVPVRTEAGCVRALVYVGRSRASGLPKPGYLQLVVAAAREWGFADSYVDSLVRWCPDSEVRNTLQRAPMRTSESKGHQQPYDSSVAFGF
jgi:hypothetical protein